MLGRFTGIRQLVEQGQLISGDKFLDLSIQNKTVHYFKRDLIWAGGYWRGIKQTSLLNKGFLGKDHVLILGHSDQKTAKIMSLSIEVLSGVGRIYGTNLSPVPRISTSIPLGVTNETSESELHRIFGNPLHFLEAEAASSVVDKFTPQIYANFTVENNSQIRGPLLKLLRNLPSSIAVTSEVPDLTPKGRVQYLSTCRSSGFVLCPEGNGFDTHRLWETLYMGGTPIVTRNKYLDDLYNRLPVVVLKSWKELKDLSQLEAKWHSIASQEWDNSLLSQAYWSKRICGETND